MDLNEKILYAVIISVVGYYLLERMNMNIESKIEKEEKLSGLEEMIIKYVNPLLNFTFRVYPLVLLSVFGVLLYNYMNNASNVTFQEVDFQTSP